MSFVSYYFQRIHACNIFGRCDPFIFYKWPVWASVGIGNWLRRKFNQLHMFGQKERTCCDKITINWIFIGWEWRNSRSFAMGKEMGTHLGECEMGTHKLEY